jgi:hypothetical protein
MVHLPHLDHVRVHTWTRFESTSRPEPDGSSAYELNAVKERRGPGGSVEVDDLGLLGDYDSVAEAVAAADEHPEGGWDALHVLGISDNVRVAVYERRSAES